jgi:UDP-glucose:(heptosyl)LPS alpha-1,3-glucosyltransferase
MRVGIAYLEYSRSKGIERISAEIADRIALRGHEVHFHCTRWEDVGTTSVRFHKVQTLDFVNSAKLLSFSVLGKASLNRGRYDITHSYGNLIGCDVITAQSCHRAGMDAAKAFRGRGIETRRNLGIADQLRLFLEHENYARRRYRRVIACSSLVKRELISYYKVPEKDVTVIHNGVNTAEFNPGNRALFRDKVRQQCGIRAEDILILFVGNEFLRKGLHKAIEALAMVEIEQVKLLVCGSDMVEPFNRLAAKFQVGPRILFAGDQKNVQEYYAAADIFVLPTLHEAFGLVITEAMASGLPVIVSKNAGAAEDVIEDGKDGVLISDPQSAKELAIKIRALVQSPSMREKVGVQARQKVVAYTWDRCAEKVLQVYEEARHEKSS